MLTIAILTLALSLGPPGSSREDPSHAVQVEWQVREWAFDVEAHAYSIAAAAGSASWERRFSALDALARARPGILSPEQIELAKRMLGDAHPNVRAQALAVCAAAGADPLDDLPSERDPFPEARRQLARALGRVPGQAADEGLLELTADEDQRVASEAIDQLLSRGSDSAWTQYKLWETGLFDRDAEAFLHALDVLERSPGQVEFYLQVKEHYQGRPSGGMPSAGRHARRALWAYLGDFHHWFPESQLLVDAWLDPMGPEQSSVERERRAKLLEAAAEGGAEVCRALLHEATRHDRIAQAGGEGAATAAWNASLYLAGALEAYPGAEREAQAGGSLDAWAAFEPNRSWSLELKLEFWEGATGKILEWSPSRHGSWLTPDVDREVRAAAISAFADTWTRTADPGSAELLIAALDDPDTELAREAWTALVGGAEGEEYAGALFRWWIAQPLAERLEDLRYLTREVRFDTPWREELVRLWASREGWSVSIIELLAVHVGDEQVEAVLSRWLDDALLALERGAVPDEDTTRGPWREKESHALWLVKAWLRVTGSTDTGRTAALLGRVGTLGKELGKTLITELARSEDGRAALEELFRGTELSRRLRIEILLLHPGLDDPEDTRLLFERYDACDEELKVRVARRIGELGLADSRELLGRVVLDSKASGVERMVALDALGACGEREAIEPVLLRVLAECRDLDLLRAAIGALGVVGGADARAELWRQWDRHDEVLGLSDVLLPALAGIELRAGGIGTKRFVDAWLERARRNAPAELEARFRGERLPSRAFLYSGLLEAEKLMVGHGQLQETFLFGGLSLELDARLLLLMGAAAREAGGPRSEARGRLFDYAALIGLHGEGDAPDRAGLVARARARLLQSAWKARDWSEAEGFATDLLEDWRTGRTTRSGFEAVFGAADREAERDPTAWLLATQAQARAWQALEAGDVRRARRLAGARTGEGRSERARRQWQELDRELLPLEGNGHWYDDGKK